MLWWRLKDFLKLWGHLFASGESRWSWVRKVIGALVFLGILRFTAWDISVLIAIQALPPLINVRLGLLIFIIAAAVWALLSAGRAYELAGIPELIIANDLVVDPLGDNFNFRLKLKSKQKDFDTTVTLIDVLNFQGESVLPGRFPIELEWTHHPSESRIHLKAGISESVSLAMMRRISLGDYELEYTGARHLGNLGLKVGDKVYFHLHVEHRRHKPIERWFSFEKVDNCKFNSEPSNPISVTR